MDSKYKVPAELTEITFILISSVGLTQTPNLELLWQEGAIFTANFP